MATVTKSRNIGSISVSLNPKKQTLEQVNRMVALILGRAGCEACGRIAYIDVNFLGDPEPDFEKLGAVSVDVRAR
jgi:hypothetical protein